MSINKTLKVGSLALFAFLALSGSAFAAGGPSVKEPAWYLWLIWILAPVGAVAALYFAWQFFKYVKVQDGGTDRMKEIAGYVTEGALAYLKRQYKVVGMVFAVMFVVFGFLAWGMGTLPPLVPVAFLTGGFFSGLCGFLGMKTATMASNRTTQGCRESLDRGLTVAFRSGAVMGLVVVGFGLLDIAAWFFLCNFARWIDLGDALKVNSMKDITITMLSFGIGASLQALFARVGGGIFTKAADVGADLVGKVEAGIPEDDPRNPATIADNVGDNVGDVAGMGADLYESYCGSILATCALGAAAFMGTSQAASNMVFRSILLPMIIAALGIGASILGIYLVRTKEGASQKQLLGALGKGVNAACALIFIVSLPASCLLLGWNSIGFGVWGSIVAGMIAGVLIGKTTEYYTSADYKPTRAIAAQTETGPATTIISGISIGMMSTAIPVIILVFATMLAFALPGGFTAGNLTVGLYGIGIAAVGMLSTLGITLATDAYGPIADNAGGNAVMSGLGEEIRKRTDALDSLGNTTAATGKGFAIGSAALTALALIAAYLEEIRSAMILLKKGVADVADGAVSATLTATAPQNIQLADFVDIFSINIMNPKFILGAFIGAMMAFLFCALTMQAVGRAAGKMVEEVRRQFKSIPGIMEGTGKPDYARCVSISTRGAQREMMFPSLLAVIVPVALGLVLGVAGVMGLLLGTLVTAFTLALFMANSGGAWDNAKKYIEAGAHGGKGSDNHKAAVVCDTVGDPFKDTSGPSLNILIKLMSMVAIVFAPTVVMLAPRIMRFLGISFGK